MLQWISDVFSRRRYDRLVNRSLEVENPHVYQFGGRWGAHISWEDAWETGRVYGHHYRLPRFGDEVEIPATDGGTLIARFIDVRLMSSPKDMFLGQLHFIE